MCVFKAAIGSVFVCVGNHVAWQGLGVCLRPLGSAPIIKTNVR